MPNYSLYNILFRILRCNYLPKGSQILPKGSGRLPKGYRKDLFTERLTGRHLFTGRLTERHLFTERPSKKLPKGTFLPEGTYLITGRLTERYLFTGRLTERHLFTERPSKIIPKGTFLPKGSWNYYRKAPLDQKESFNRKALQNTDTGKFLSTERQRFAERPTKNTTGTLLIGPVPSQFWHAAACRIVL